MLINMRNKMKCQKGFTLIELMVVVAILGILAAIAVPRFADASNSARGAKIAADLRTIDSAVQMAVANGEYTVGTATTGAIPATVLTYLAGTPTPPPTGSTIRRSAAHEGALATTTETAYGIDATGRAELDGHTSDWY